MIPRRILSVLVNNPDISESPLNHEKARKAGFANLSYVGELVLYRSCQRFKFDTTRHLWL
jgi:hypothetical protein